MKYEGLGLTPKLSKEGVLFGIILLLLNFADGLMTLQLTNVFGFGIEVNPLMRYFMETSGNWFLWKGLAGFAVAILITLYWRKYSLVRIASLVVIFIFAFVVGYQTVLLRML
jgi:hypothetical protein